MTSQQPIKRLNKRLIYWCLVGLIVLTLPAIFSLASINKRQPSTEKNKETHANVYVQDSKIITGMENFPDTYSDVKSFEKKTSEVKKEDDLENALAELESKNNGHEAPLQPHNTGNQYGHDDDPWREASKRDQKQRASDHYDAKRSDILFVDNVKNHKDETGSNSVSSPPNDIMLNKNDASIDKGNDFLHGNKNSIGILKNPSQYMVSEGTLISAILLSEINTDLPGPILARVSHNIWDSKTGQTLLIPQNSKLIGEYNSTVGHGQNRAQIVWTRIIYPNQQSIDLGRMVGVDKKATSGSAGTVDNHYDKVALALLMTTTLGAGVRITRGKYDPNTASIGDDIGNSLAQETARIGSRIADKSLSVKPTITVPMGERLNIFVEQDLHLEPYSG